MDLSSVLTMIDIDMKPLPDPATAPQLTANDLYYDAIEQLANGRAAEAVTSFRAAIEARKDFLDARHGLILALDAAGNVEEGIAVALQLIADEPDDVLAYTSLSILYQHAGKVPEAEAASAKAKILGWKHELRGKDAGAGNP
jgi:tetratricopeptide (TPR) repeat protein